MQLVYFQYRSGIQKIFYFIFYICFSEIVYNLYLFCYNITYYKKINLKDIKKRRCNCKISKRFMIYIIIYTLYIYKEIKNK